MAASGRFSENSLRRFISVLNSIRFRDELGQVEYFGQKVVILRRDAFALMRKELAKVAGSASNVILEIAGRRVGAEEGRALLAKAESLGMKTGASMGEFVRIALEETNMGYGKMKLEQSDESNGNVVVTIHNSFETDSTDKVSSPSCFYTLGYVEGLLSVLLGKNLKGRETSCYGRGDPFCIFDFTPKS
jgi:predicted hydrocarbon binding protein